MIAGNDESSKEKRRFGFRYRALGVLGNDGVPGVQLLRVFDAAPVRPGNCLANALSCQRAIQRDFHVVCR